MVTNVINSGDTAWVLASAALVLFMTPGLAIFYGGMVRAKSTLNIMMMSFSAMGVTTIIWVLYGYSLAFGKSHNGLIGNLDHVGLAKTLDQVTGAEGHQIPTLAFAMFQLTFAIITVALISGAIADRAKFSSWIIFVAVWITLVYLPLAHWAFASQGGEGGWIIDRLGALDFAGGTVVEINSGAAALALVLVLGKREGFKTESMRPHNMPLVLLERFRDGKATTLGIASGAIAGAVAITPACGFVNPLGALVIGLLAGAVSAIAVSRKYKWGYDDSLDVVGVHGVGGFLGMLAIGFLATTTANSAGGLGLLTHGSSELLQRQLVAIGATALFSFTATWLIGTVISKTIGFRANREDELTGLDTTYHAESAYDISGNANRY